MLLLLLISGVISAGFAALVLSARRGRRKRPRARGTAVDVPRALRRSTVTGGVAGLVAMIVVATAIGLSSPATAKKATTTTSSSGGTTTSSDSTASGDSLSAPTTTPSTDSSSSGSSSSGSSSSGSTTSGSGSSGSSSSGTVAGSGGS